MYTSYIGKKFLNLWNEREGKNLTAKQFCTDIMFPIFFGERPFLMKVPNSPFSQIKPPKEKASSAKTEVALREEKLHRDIEEKKFTGATFVGYAAGDVNAGTSGQSTNIITHNSLGDSIEKDLFNDEDAYASWIGAGLSIGIENGLCWLIYHEEILWIIYSGWHKYRNYVRKTPEIAPDEILNWNSQWIRAYLINSKNPEYYIKPIQSKGNIHIAESNWVEVLLSLCRHNIKEPILTTYTYSFNGKSNKTIGFLNLHLSEVRNIYELREKLFSEHLKIGLTEDDIEHLEPYYEFSAVAREHPKIGLSAIKPKILESKEVNFKKESDLKNYLISKLWVTAMLGRKEFLEMAEGLSQILYRFEESSSGRTTEEKNLSKKAREAKNLKDFIDAWEKILDEIIESEHSPSEIDTVKVAIRSLVKEPPIHFSFFVSLLRLEYLFLRYESKYNKNEATPDLN